MGIQGRAGYFPGSILFPHSSCFPTMNYFIDVTGDTSFGQQEFMCSLPLNVSGFSCLNEIFLIPLSHSHQIQSLLKLMGIFPFLLIGFRSYSIPWSMAQSQLLWLLELQQLTVVLLSHQVFGCLGSPRGQVTQFHRLNLDGRPIKHHWQSLLFTEFPCI